MPQEMVSPVQATNGYKNDPECMEGVVGGEIKEWVRTTTATTTPLSKRVGENQAKEQSGVSPCRRLSPALKAEPGSSISVPAALMPQNDSCL